MNVSSRALARVSARLRQSWSCATLLLGLTSPLLAQSVFKIGPEITVRPAPLGAARAASREAERPTRPPFEWAGFTVRPYFSYSFLHGNGIQVQPGEELSTDVENFAGGLILGLGPYWSLNYTGMQYRYSNPAFRDSFDNAVSLSGEKTYHEWTFRLFQAYAESSLPLVETGGQTPQKEHNTIGTVAYSFGRRALAEVSFLQNLRFPEIFSMTREHAGTGWFHYKLAPQLDLAAGLRGGFVDVRPGNNMSYERPQLRLEWRLSDTLLLQVTGGREHRRFYSHPDVDLNRTVFDASIEYSPVRTTILSYARARDFEISYFSSQLAENTRHLVEFQQRLLTHFHFLARYDQQDVRFIGTPRVFTAFNPRRDERRGWQAQLLTTFLQRGTISVSYSEQRNRSNLEEYSFTSHQYGFSIGYRF